MRSNIIWLLLPVLLVKVCWSKSLSPNEDTDTSSFEQGTSEHFEPKRCNTIGFEISIKIDKNVQIADLNFVYKMYIR